MNRLTHRIRRIGQTIVCLLCGVVFTTAAESATMQLPTTNVTLGASFSVPLTIDSGASALGAYDLTVSFDTNVLQFVSVTGGNGEFSSTPDLVVVLGPGQVRYVHTQQSSTNSPTGASLVSRVNFSAVGTDGGSSSLSISDAHVYNTSGLDIPLTNIQNGQVNLQAPPQLVVTPDSQAYGTVSMGQSQTLPFQVANTGGQTLTGTATVGGPFEVSNGSPFSVAPGDTTIVNVSFVPDSAGDFSNAVIFTSNGGSSTNAVTGTGLTPGQMVVSPFSLNLGTVATGTTAQASFVVTNTGGTAFSGSVSIGAGPFVIFSGSPFSLAGFKGTNVVIRFTPQAEGGFTNAVVFSSTVGNSTNVVIGQGAIVPVASFSGTPTNGHVPLSVTFTDTSTGTITDRFWNFGDGFTTNVDSTTVVHDYTVAGTSTVSLIVSGPVGVSTNTRANYVVVTNNPPILSVSPTSRDFGSVTIGQTNTMPFQVINLGELTLTGTATVAGPFAVTSGSPYSVPGGQTGSVSVSFIPNSVGAFSNGVVFSSNGGKSTNTVIGTGLTAGQMGVSPTSIDFGSVVTGAIVQATFVVTNTGGSVLSNGTAVVSGGPFAIVSGGSFNLVGFGSTNVVVSFKPLSEGGFTNSVVFSSSNSGGSTNAVRGAGAIVPVAVFSGNPTNGLAPLSVTFTDTSTGTITNRFWSFGDGAATNIVSTNIVHTYTVAGTNTVSLIVSGPVGASTNTQVGYVIVTNIPSPIVNFAASPTAGMTPLAVTFSNLTSGAVNSFLWNFGDGGSSTSINPGHVYTVAGNYDVSLTAFGPGGTNTVSKPGFIAVTPDTQPPALTILTPTESQVFSNMHITVTGTATDASGIQSLTVNGLAAAISGSDWSQPFTLSTGTNTIIVIAKDNSVNANSTTGIVHAILTPLTQATDTNAPVVHITSPTNGFVTAEKMISALGNATDDNVVSSVIVTNSRGGSIDASLIGTNWTADGVTLKLGTNKLFAVASDGVGNQSADMVTVIRITTNYVNTTLHAGKVTLVLGAASNSDSVSFSGLYNNAGVSFNPSNDVIEVMFGDYEATLASNSLVKLKFKGTNSLTAFSIVPKKRGINFKASDFSLTNGQPFLVAIALGAKDLGPDAITFPGFTNGAGQFAWAFGKQLPAVDQFFLGKSKLTTNSFQLTGTINILGKPNVLTNVVSFGIGAYDESLPTNGWTKGVGNVYTYIRPAGHTGAVTAMSLNFDLGKWSAKGSGANLSFLGVNPTTDIRLEIADFAASYPAQLVPKGTGFGY